MKAIVLGSTGLVGKKLIEVLIEESRISKIMVITRRSLALESDKIKELLIKDLQEIKSIAPEPKADLYFCCLGTTIKKAGSREAFREVDELAVMDFAKRAAMNPASVFILVSSKGANEQSLIFYSKIKGRVERLVMELGISRVIIFRPSLLIGRRDENRFGESIGIKAYQALAGVLPKSWMKTMGTNVDVLARAMVKKGLSSSHGVEILESHQIEV